MATSSIVKITGRVKLENGTDAEGNIKYVNQSLGDLSEAYFATNPTDAVTKLWNIKTTLAPILSKTVGYLETVTTSEITNA